MFPDGGPKGLPGFSPLGTKRGVPDENPEAVHNAY